MKRFSLLLLPLLVLPLSGCVFLGVPKTIKALANDPATIRLRFPTPYGVVELDRASPQPGIAPHDLTNNSIHVGEAGVAGLNQSVASELVVPLRLKLTTQ